MSIRNLEFLFNPSSVAVIGASNRPHSVGAVVMRNLLGGGFDGPIMPVNPKHAAVAAVVAYPDVDHLPVVPDLAVICTPPATVPGLIRDLGRRGTRAAVVLTAGLEGQKDEQGRTLHQAVLAESKPHLLRVLGPNCVGLLVPRIGLNASFAHAPASPGGVAFVTQSGALSTAVLDYARANEIGFSCFVSLGNKLDVDFGDVLDYLAADPQTTSILLYMESIRDAPKFMSAARAAASAKPVVAVKAGRVPEAAQAAMSHTDAMAGADDVFDAALRRAGILRVNTIEDLFDSVETLALAKPVPGDRLAVLTNGGGLGVMATDALVLAGGRLAKLSEQTVQALSAVLPANWSRANPVDIIGDAPPERYVSAMKVLLGCPDCDAILFVQAPTAIVPSQDVAAALAPLVRESGRTVLSCWVGRDAVAAARRTFNEAGVPTYDSPEDAVAAFLQLTRHRQSQAVRVEVPPSRDLEFKPDLAAARRVIDDALADGRSLLSEPEAKAVLVAFGVPVVETRVAATAAEAERVASLLGLPVALKILSPDLTHKSDVGGVVLDLETARDVRAAAEVMLGRLRRLRPQARLEGFTVERMARRPGAQELIVGIATDPIFGPVVLFGQGGTAVEVIGDRAISLPPLNEALAREVIGRTRVSKLLAGYRGHPPADFTALCAALVRISQLAAELPEVAELDINPLLADEKGVLALDTRIRLDQSSAAGAARFAIRPYPRELEEAVTIDGRPLLIRPLRPEDEPAYSALLGSVSCPENADGCFAMLASPPGASMPRHAQIDYNRQMVFVATERSGGRRIIAAARTASDPDNLIARCSLAATRDAPQGLTDFLLSKMINYCRSRGTSELAAFIDPCHERGLQLAERFKFSKVAGGPSQQVRLWLGTQEHGAPRLAGEILSRDSSLEHQEDAGGADPPAHRRPAAPATALVLRQQRLDRSAPFVRTMPSID